MIISIMTAAGTQALWYGERIICAMTASMQSGEKGVKFYTNLHGSAASPLATYTPQANGAVNIDVTDYVRAYKNTLSALYFVDVNNSTTYTIAVGVVGYINPAEVLIPPFGLNGSSGGTILFLPPSRMIAPIGNLPLKIGEYMTADAGNYYGIGASHISSVAATDGVSISDKSFSLFYRYTQNGQIKWKTLRSYSLAEQLCGVQYAAVRWVSFTGATRLHTFEVVKQKISADGAFSLLTMTNEYDEAKGRVDAFSLRLDMLDAYDLWYYSDILTSSKVEVSPDGTNWTRVQVTDKAITLPDGEAGTKGELEIKVNWKRYDAVAM